MSILSKVTGIHISPKHGIHIEPLKAISTLATLGSFGALGPVAGALSAIPGAGAVAGAASKIGGALKAIPGVSAIGGAIKGIGGQVLDAAKANPLDTALSIGSGANALAQQQKADALRRQMLSYATQGYDAKAGLRNAGLSAAMNPQVPAGFSAIPYQDRGNPYARRA